MQDYCAVADQTPSIALKPTFPSAQVADFNLSRLMQESTRSSTQAASNPRWLVRFCLTVLCCTVLGAAGEGATPYSFVMAAFATLLSEVCQATSWVCFGVMTRLMWCLPRYWPALLSSPCRHLKSCLESAPHLLLTCSHLLSSCKLMRQQQRQRQPCGARAAEADKLVSALQTLFTRHL